MLSKVWRPLKLPNQGSDDEVKKNNFVVGLRILTEKSNSKREANVVVKSDLKLSKKTVFETNQINNSNSIDYCFLKSCFLCSKTLALDKEVYMYRGDEGFCSVECRNRKIYLDEIRELEISTKKTLASIRRCRRDSDCGETMSFREELRPRRHRRTEMIFI